MNKYKTIALVILIIFGGHHLKGILVFPPIFKENSKMTLVIKDIYGVKERTFLWNLI